MKAGMRYFMAAVGGCLAAAMAGAPALAAGVNGQAKACRELVKMKLASSEVVTATYAKAPFSPPLNGMSFPQDGYSAGGAKRGAVDRNFCRVEVLSRPTFDSFVMIEIWLPFDWNGKFQGVGGGKLFGAINYVGMSNAVDQGYAAMASDAGHRSSRADLTWVIDHPEKVTDYLYRADYQGTIAAKAIIKKFYGRDPEHSYFVGCARGGSTGLEMARRYPDLYDGIYAGSPGADNSNKMANFIWMAQSNLLDPAFHIADAKFAMISRAALKACDGLDGLVDGQITNPGSCTFEPSSILCKPGQKSDCLTDREVQTLEKLYAGPRNPRTGEEIFPGRPAKGSEQGWPFLIDAKSGTPGFALTLGALLFNSLDWDWKTFDFDKDLAEVKRRGAHIDMLSLDLRAFGRHGKLILTHGWQDPLFSPVHALGIYQGALRASGAGMVDNIRFFEVPGMGHCGGGTGPNVFDPVKALDDWVAGGKAPDRIIATKFEDGDPAKSALRTRPLCPYPQRAQYLGRGDINRAENFVCK